MPQNKRIEAIDQFRGLTIIGMVLANYLAGVRSVPGWLKHADDVGLTVIDLVAPFFIFAIALTYRPSFLKRLERTGWPQTLWHFFRRYTAIAGIGFLIHVFEEATGIGQVRMWWGVLEAIGAAGLLTLFVIWTPTAVRLIVAVVMLVGYQLLLDYGGWLEIVLHSSHGGMHGAVSWTAMLVLGTVLADAYHSVPKGRKAFPWAALAVLVLGLVLMWWFPVSKNRISSTYVLISTGTGGLLFWGFHLYAARHEDRLKLLVAWGANPLFLYIVHLLVLAVYDIPPVPWWFHEAPMWLVAVEIAFLLGAMSWLATAMHRRRILLSL